MNKSNSPEAVVSQPFAGAKREWSDLSHTLLASYASGFQTPALCLPLTGNSTVVLNMEHALQTNPTVTPVFDSQRVNVRAFFYPQRLCCRGLVGNNYMELNEIEELELPTITLSRKNAVTSSTQAILPGSLLNRLGFPSVYFGKSWVPFDRKHCYSSDYDLGVSGATLTANDVNVIPQRNSFLPVDAIGSSQIKNYTWNMSPVVGYYDICSHFLSNPYDPEIPMPEYAGHLGPMMRGDNGVILPYDSSVSITGYTYHSLYDLRDWLLRMKGIATSVGSSTIPTQASLFAKVSTSNTVGFQNGIKGPLGDLTVTLSTVTGDTSDPENTGKSTYGSIFPIGQKSYQQGLFPSLYMEDNLSVYFDSDEIMDLMAVDYDNGNGKVTESTLRMGSSVFNRMFRSILRGRKYGDWAEIHFGKKLKLSDHPIFVGADYFNVTFNDVLNNSASSQSVPLGASASRGNKGRGNKRPISFTALEPGYLFVIIDLVPYVSYSNALPNWLDWKTYADFPLPEYAGRAFSDLKVGDMVFTESDDSNYSVVGKQPLYYSHMATHDRLGGIFDTNLLDTYTFKRTFNVTGMGDGGITTQLASDIGSTYIRKGLYDYAFPDWGQNGGENFFIKTQFDLRVLQPIPRDVLKTRV